MAHGAARRGTPAITGSCVAFLAKLHGRWVAAWKKDENLPSLNGVANVMCFVRRRAQEFFVVV